MVKSLKLKAKQTYFGLPFVSQEFIMLERENEVEECEPVDPEAGFIDIFTKKQFVI